MVKAIVGLVIVGGLVLAAVYYFGGTRTFDPAAQGRQARAAITPGMSWEQVADIAEPKGYRIVQEKKQKTFDGEKVIREPGLLRDWDRAFLGNEVDKGQMPHGFVFDYVFTHQEAFQVWFDGDGKVVEIGDLPTMADLLDTRGGG